MLAWDQSALLQLNRSWRSWKQHYKHKHNRQKRKSQTAKNRFVTRQMSNLLTYYILVICSYLLRQKSIQIEQHFFTWTVSIILLPPLKFPITCSIRFCSVQATCFCEFLFRFLSFVFELCSFSWFLQRYALSTDFTALDLDRTIAHHLLHSYPLSTTWHRSHFGKYSR